MIDIKQFYQKLSNHVSLFKSASIVCKEHASFESWFRVEIIPVIWDMCFSNSTILLNYNYPGSREKADLCIRTIHGDIVIELKPFVVNQEANKIYEYPTQIKRLENLFNAQQAIQVIAITTFIGYSQTQLNNRMNKFFTSPPWGLLGPTKLIPQYDLYISFASIPLYQGSSSCKANVPLE